MFARALDVSHDKSFFLFGPRGTGKSTLIRAVFPDALTLDLLDLGVYAELLAHPERLEALARSHGSTRIVIDEIQRIPAWMKSIA